MLRLSPLKINDIFKVLPNDLIGEILSFSTHVEILFNHARVCQYWKTTCHGIIWKYYENRIQNLCKSVGKFDEFLYSKLGRKFIKYLIRRHVYDLAGKLKNISTVSNPKLEVTVNDVWVDAELSMTKSYFKQFADLTCNPMAQPKNDQSSQKGFFSNVFSAIGSLFSKSTTQPSVDSSMTPRNEILPKPEFDFIFKVVLEGNYSAGKSSFLACGMNEKPVDPNANFYYGNIGLEFANRTFIFGDTTKGVLQLWDKVGQAHYHSMTLSYYRNSTFILLLVDPFNKASIETIPQYLQNFKTYAPNSDIILITTKKDKEQERLLTNEQAELIAFDNFGGLHLDITNTELDEPRQILIYCTLLKYFLLP